MGQVLSALKECAERLTNAHNCMEEASPSRMVNVSTSLSAQNPLRFSLDENLHCEKKKPIIQAAVMPSETKTMTQAMEDSSETLTSLASKELNY